jgi:hypothetical protein
MTTTNNNFRVKNGLEVATTASMATLQFTGDSSVQTTAYTGTGTLVANSVNAEVAAYATTFNTGTLVANSVNAEVAAYATTFNTSTLVATAVTALNAGTTIPLITAAQTASTSTATGKLVSISDNGGRLAYYNNTLTDWLYVGTDEIVYTPPPPPTGPPVADYIQWFDYTSFNDSAHTWSDLSIYANNATVTGTPVTATTGPTAGSSASITYVGGYTGDTVNFGSMPATYTLFTVLRKPNTANSGWLVLGDASNTWLSGTFGSVGGIAYHEGWVNSSPPPSPNYGSDWLISVDQNYFYRPNGNTASQGTSGSGTYPGTWGINVRTGLEVDEWWVAEIIVYDRTLNSTEISDTESYLATRYGITLGV